MIFNNNDKYIKLDLIGKWRREIERNSVILYDRSPLIFCLLIKLYIIKKKEKISLC